MQARRCFQGLFRRSTYSVSWWCSKGFCLQSLSWNILFMDSLFMEVNGYLICLKKIRNKKVMFGIKKKSAIIPEIVPSNSTVYVNEILELNCIQLSFHALLDNPEWSKFIWEASDLIKRTDIAVSAKGYTWQSSG